ncbi:MAG: glycosyltransferase [Bacteroidaceae bacterium]
MKLWIEKIRLAVQKRLGLTNNRKSREAWLAKGHLKTPEVTFLIQSHNKSAQVRHIVGKLRGVPGCEIIVIDDGSDGTAHTAALTAFLTGANEFLIRSNDLYENIMYDKALRFANGRYVALLQDDDDFPSLAWVDEALTLLRRHPRMVLLGGKDGLDIAFDDERRWAHGGSYPHAGDFSFVPAVNRAPMWVNKDLFARHLRHIDYAFAPFQFDDYELCARAWMSGLQVGWYDARFRSLSVGGMRLWNNAFTTEQSRVNGERLYALYADHRDEIHRRVTESNRDVPSIG